MPAKISRLAISRGLIALLFILAGILHFVMPATYAHVIPPVFPAPFVLVYISGIAEIFGGIGVLIPRLRPAAGWGLIALLIAVFPANLYMFQGQLQQHGWVVFTFILLLRLPLQLLLISWVYRSAVRRTT